MSKLVLLGLSALVMTTLFQNCGRFKSSGFNDNSGLAPPPIGKVTFKKVNTEILQANCVGCHNTALPQGGVDYADYNKTIASGSVIPSNHSASSLYTTGVAGSMPQGGAHLSAFELKEIAAWIDDGAMGDELPVVNAGGDVVVTYIGTSTAVALYGTASDPDGTIATTLWTQVSGPGTSSFSAPNTLQTQAGQLAIGTYVFKLNAVDDGGASASDDVSVNVVSGVSLASLTASIFTPKCSSCHNATSAGGGYNMATYATLKTRVIVGDGAGSKLYQRCADNTMPRLGTPLLQSEKDQIRDWINQGALFN